MKYATTIALSHNLTMAFCFHLNDKKSNVINGTSTSSSIEWKMKKKYAMKIAAHKEVHSPTVVVNSQL